MRDTGIETAKRDISRNPIKKTIILGFYGSYIKYQTFANEEFKEDKTKLLKLKPNWCMLSIQQKRYCT